MSYNLTAGAYTDVGMKRDHNEDYFYRSDLDKTVNRSEGYLFVAADGVGGNRGGGEASRIACEQLPKHFFDPERQTMPLIKRLTDAIHLTHHDIRAIAEANPAIREMSCTIVILAVAEDKAAVAHLGDARIYRLNHSEGGTFTQITKDHSWVQEQVDVGLLTDEQAAVHRNRNVVTRTLGGSNMHAPEVNTITLEESDRYLLCSDGLHGPVMHSDLTRSIRQDSELDTITEQLVALANQNGGPDNIVALIVQIGDWESLTTGSNEKTVPSSTVVLRKNDTEPLPFISPAVTAHPKPASEAEAVPPRSHSATKKHEPNTSSTSKNRPSRRRFGCGIWGIIIILFLTVAALLAWLLFSGDTAGSNLIDPPESTEIALVVTIPTTTTGNGDSSVLSEPTSTLAPESTATETLLPTNTPVPTSEVIETATSTATPDETLTPTPAESLIVISTLTQEIPKLALLDIRCTGNHSFEPNEEINFKWLGKASDNLEENEEIRIAIQPIDPAKGIAELVVDSGSNILPVPTNGEWIVPRKLSSFGIVAEGDINWWVEYKVDGRIVDKSNTGCFRIIPPANNQDASTTSEPDVSNGSEAEEGD